MPSKQRSPHTAGNGIPHSQPRARSGNGGKAPSPRGEKSEKSEKPSSNGGAHAVASTNGRVGTMPNASGAQVPVREWEHLSAASRAEIEHMVEVLKAMKEGDFSVRFEYEKHGVLSRA